MRYKSALLLIAIPLAFLAGYIVSVALWGSSDPLEKITPGKSIDTIVASLSVLFCGVLFLPRGKRSFGLTHFPSKSVIRWTGFGFGIPLVVWILCSILGISSIRFTPNEFSFWVMLVTWALIFLHAASEEIIFRGVMLTALDPLVTKRLANLLTSIAFGLLHFGALENMLSAVLLGYLMAMVRRRTNTLWTAIGFHASWNFAVDLSERTMKIGDFSSLLFETRYHNLWVAYLMFCAAIVLVVVIMQRCRLRDDSLL